MNIENLIKDIKESYELAMRCAGISEEVIKDISSTVDDAIVNNL